MKIRITRHAPLVTVALRLARFLTLAEIEVSAELGASLVATGLAIEVPS